MNSRTMEIVVGRSEQALPWLTLILLLSYTFLELAHAPYLGFDFNPSSGDIQEVFSDSSLMQPGDRLHRVNGLLFTKWADHLRRPLVPDVQSGDTIEVQFYRQGKLQSVTWTITDPTWVEFLARLVNIWPLGYFFWFAGLATVFSLRPRNNLQRIFTLFFFLTAIWIVAGNSSRRNLWEASVVFRMAVWLCVPVYLHLHWSFPRRLRNLPRWVFPLLYLLGVAAALLQWFELLPKQAYAVGFIVALLGSLIFLLIHFVRRPDERQHLAVILYSFLFALLPSAVLSIAAALQSAARLGGLALLALPILPVGYFYAIYRHRLGGVEIRTNRLIILFLYLIVLGTAVIALSVIMAALPVFPGQGIVTTLTTALVAVLITLKGYQRFERWVEIYFLGIPYPAENLLESYLLRITTSLTKTDLVHILRDEIMPSLLIRQSALLLVKNTDGELLYAQGIRESEIPPLSAFSDLLESPPSHQIRSIRQPQETDSWLQVCVPHVLGERVLALWLLGKHDPDDLYTSRELASLENIARQTAMALVNIEQAEQLQMFYQADIQRHEEERGRLARTLHDEILNQAAIAYNSLGTSALTERFEREYELLKKQIRRMISDLRPSTLRWGLHIALEELADNLNERGNGSPTVEFSIPYSDERYPEQNEDQIYRIVQQACENAFRHSAASHIQIAGLLLLNRVEIHVIDDGIGFDAEEMSFSNLLERKQYGLVGMYERAKMIGAEFAVESQIDDGATVHLRWLNDTIINPTIHEL